MMGLFNHKCKAKNISIGVDDRWGKCPWCNVGVN